MQLLLLHALQRLFAEVGAGERIRFTHAVDQRQIGESCELEILRDGKARATIPESAPPRWFGMANGGSRR